MAKHFYSEMVPELRELVHQGKASGDEEKAKAAAALEAKLAEVLQSADHRWYVNKMDPAEQEARQQRQEEFKKRYGE